MNAKFCFNKHYIALERKELINKYIKNMSSNDATPLLPSIYSNIHLFFLKIWLYYLENFFDSPFPN